MERKPTHGLVGSLAALALVSSLGAFALGDREPRTIAGLCIATVTICASVWYAIRRPDILSRINRQIAKAEQLTVAPGYDDTLQRASKVLAELKDQRRDVEAKLSNE